MTRADAIVVLLTLAMLPALYIYSWGESSRGTNAVVSFARAQPTTFGLDENRIVEIEGSRGKSILEVNDGAIRFVASPCHGKQCIHAGWLRLSGDFAACLPNQVSVLVAGDKRRFDAINF